MFCVCVFAGSMTSTVSLCNGVQLVGAVQVNITPLISKDVLGTDASGCSHLASSSASYAGSRLRVGPATLTPA